MTINIRRTIKNQDDIENEHCIKNKDILKNEDNTKMSMALTTLPEKLLMTPDPDRHSKTDPEPEMLLAVLAGNRI